MMRPHSETVHYARLAEAAPQEPEEIVKQIRQSIHGRTFIAPGAAWEGGGM
jgi:hypothetical protein